MRPPISEPPGAKPTMIFTGRSGNPCARLADGSERMIDLILLPVLVSWVKWDEKYRSRVEQRQAKLTVQWARLARITERKPAAIKQAPAAPAPPPAGAPTAHAPGPPSAGTPAAPGPAPSEEPEPDPLDAGVPLPGGVR